MKILFSLLVTFYACLLCSAQQHPALEFYDGLEKVQDKYRVGMSALLKKADRVVVYLVDFDGFLDGDSFGELDDPKSILVAPYDKSTKILKQKELGEDDRKKLLEALSTQIAKTKHTGGALCHMPIHGIRIYSGEDVIHEGTFCWHCSNFSFSYPNDSGWLDTNAELKAIFTKLMPIPQSELDRFHKKYPTDKTKDPKATEPK